MQTLSFRGRRSRNKVSVGEPAEGSFTRIIPSTCIPVGERGACGDNINATPVGKPGVDGETGQRSPSRRATNVTPLTIFTLGFLELHAHHITTFSDGCLGSGNDEGRSEMR